MALLKKNIIPDPKDKFPSSLAEAKTLIEKTFALNEWGEPEQLRYFAGMGIEAEKTADLKVSDARKVITDLLKNRMILCK